MEIGGNAPHESRIDVIEAPSNLGLKPPAAIPAAGSSGMDYWDLPHLRENGISK